MSITIIFLNVYSSIQNSDILEISVCIIVFLYSRCVLSGFDHHNDFENVAPALFVSLFDCSKMTENEHYSLNKISKCNIEATNSDTTLILSLDLYQRLYSTTVSATRCTISPEQKKWFCGLHGCSGMDSKQHSLTVNLIKEPQACALAAKTGQISVPKDYGDRSIPIVLNVLKDSVVTELNGIDWIRHGDGKSRNECKDTGWVVKDSYQTFMENVILNVDLKTMRIRNVYNFSLPCKVSEGGCPSTSLDVGTYTWNQPENCLFKKIRSVYNGQMIKFNDQYFISTDPKSKLDDLHFFFENFTDQQNICGHPLPVYPTNYEDFFIHYSGRFDMNTGQPKKLHQNQPTITKLRIEGDDEIDFRNLQYDVHLGAKFDYFLHRTNLNIHAFQVKIIQNQCELERTQMLTILTMALENTRLAGYLLTGNRSMFLDTDGSVAWLYQCPKVRSTLWVMDKCYDKIPIFYENRVHFVDPITRQTFLSANEISCQRATQNLIQLDMDNDNSWYNLILHPVFHNTPLAFSPTRLSRQVCMYLILLIMPDCKQGKNCHSFGTMLNLAIIQKIYLKKLLVNWSIRILIHIK